MTSSQSFDGDGGGSLCCTVFASRHASASLRSTLRSFRMTRSATSICAVTAILCTPSTRGVHPRHHFLPEVTPFTETDSHPLQPPLLRKIVFSHINRHPRHPPSDPHPLEFGLRALLNRPPSRGLRPGKLVAAAPRQAHGVTHHPSGTVGQRRLFRRQYLGHAREHCLERVLGDAVGRPLRNDHVCGDAADRELPVGESHGRSPKVPWDEAGVPDPERHGITDWLSKSDSRARILEVVDQATGRAASAAT